MDEQVAASKALAARIKPYKHSTLSYQSGCQRITLSDTRTAHTRRECVWNRGQREWKGWEQQKMERCQGESKRGAKSLSLREGLCVDEGVRVCVCACILCHLASTICPVAIVTVILMPVCVFGECKVNVEAKTALSTPYPHPSAHIWAPWRVGKARFHTCPCPHRCPIIIHSLRFFMAPVMWNKLRTHRMTRCSLRAIPDRSPLDNVLIKVPRRRSGRQLTSLPPKTLQLYHGTRIHSLPRDALPGLMRACVCV